MATQTKGQKAHPITLALEKYRKACAEHEEAQKQLKELDKKRAVLLRQIERLDIVIETLDPIASQEWEIEDEQRQKDWHEARDLGIQECCYRVLQDAQQALSAITIRRHLEEEGVDLKRYANPLAVIHTSLKRIPERVRSFRRKETVGRDQSRKAWVRYYEAIKPEAEKPPQQ